MDIPRVSRAALVPAALGQQWHCREHRGGEPRLQPLLLRHLWHPEGWQWLADELLHDIMPLLFLGYWWRCVPKGTLRVWHIALWVIYPLLYFAYSLLRGHLLAVYPYPFVDVDKLGYPQVFINAGGLLVGFVVIALLAIGLDRWRARK